MAFVNEYISEEDIKLNQIDKQYLKDNPIYKTIPSGFKPQWTIDRKRQITLQLFRRANQRDREGSWTEFELNIAGKILICRMERGPGRSFKFSDNPFIISWDLASIKPEHVYQMPYEQVTEILKEGLTVFGYDGIRDQIPNTIVNCNF